MTACKHCGFDVAYETPKYDKAGWVHTLTLQRLWSYHTPEPVED